jgi:nucleoside-diphosphate-sugar epimerase
MKVLLTGATGFVGSHVLDCLHAREIPVAVLLRTSSSRRLIEHRRSDVELRTGSINDPASLDRALADVTHVIHCAGLTKAVRSAEFYTANQSGTRHIVEAINRKPDQIKRLVHISSLAAAGPAGPESPAKETDPPRPVSEYGRSKLAAENEIREHCRADFVILRPSAVYGPRDGEFLHLFKAVKKHLLPQFGGGRQALSLVEVRDLAETVVQCLTPPAAAGRTYFVAAPEVVTARALAAEIAAQLDVWTLPLPGPLFALWPICLAGQAIAQMTKRPAMLSLHKYPELRAPGWVCSPARLRDELGLNCPTDLKSGIATTLAWYRENQWL